MTRVLLTFALLNNAHAVTVSNPNTLQKYQADTYTCPTGAESGCTNYRIGDVRIRTSLHDMPAADQERFLLSVEKMMQGGLNGTFAHVAGMHGYPNYNCIHSRTEFNAWHRVHMALFEAYLVDAHFELYGNDNIAVPYLQMIDGQKSGGPVKPKTLTNHNGYMWGSRWNKPDTVGPFDVSLQAIVERLSTAEAIQGWLADPATTSVVRPATWINGAGDTTPETDVFTFYTQGVAIAPLKLPNVGPYSGWLAEVWFQQHKVRPLVDKLRRLTSASDYVLYANEIEGTIHNVGHWIHDGALEPHATASLSPIFFVWHNLIEFLHTRGIDKIGSSKSSADAIEALGSDIELAPFKHADGSAYTVSDSLVDNENECLTFETSNRSICWKYVNVERSRVPSTSASKHGQVQAEDSTALEEIDVMVTSPAATSNCTLAGAIDSFVAYVLFVAKDKTLTEEEAKQVINDFTEGKYDDEELDMEDGVGIIIVNHFGGSKSDMSNVAMSTLAYKKDIPADYTIQIYLVDHSAAHTIGEDAVGTVDVGKFLSSECKALGITGIDATWVTVTPTTY